MAVHHPGEPQSLEDLQRNLRSLITQSLANMSFGSSGLRVHSGGWIRVEDGGGVSIDGTLSATTKLFRVPHPSREGYMLAHGSTESPVSGVEYWGEDTIPDTGVAMVVLPDYFEALTKPEGRAVLVTGRGFTPDWGDVEAGRFWVSGPAGGRFSWLVKAERQGAEFEVEAPN